MRRCSKGYCPCKIAALERCPGARDFGADAAAMPPGGATGHCSNAIPWPGSGGESPASQGLELYDNQDFRKEVNRGSLKVKAMHVIRLSTSLLLGALSSAPISAEPDHAVSRVVVQVRGVDEQGKMYYGSGVVTGPNTVATNCHVVRGGGRIAVFLGYRSFRVERERADTLRDLCLLEAPGLASPVARIGKAAGLKRGHPLSFYGYPRALGMAYSAGTVKSLHPFGGSRIIETSAFFTLGGSGGGLFDRSGKLVGLATFLAPGHGGAYYAIPADWIAAVRAQAPQAIAPLPGRSFWEETAHLPAFLRRPGP